MTVGRDWVRMKPEEFGEEPRPVDQGIQFVPDDEYGTPDLLAPDHDDALF